MKKSIVYLDDDPGCLDIFELTLNDEYEVRTAATPETLDRAKNATGIRARQPCVLCSQR
ncbi:MAG: hypothetical protein LC754_05070 [Acidobacteria bacterium]|nr:hypothetical protein [Acidobacteriota bacterium]